jgi:hypothetical protein
MTAPNGNFTVINPIGVPEQPQSKSLSVVHVTEAPRGGVLSYLEEVVAYQAKAENISRVDVITPAINLSQLRHLAGEKVHIHALPDRKRSLGYSPSPEELRRS